MLDAELHRVFEHHVSETAAGAKGFQAPLQPLPREAVLECLIETLQRAVEIFGDGFAYRRSHERIKYADEVVGFLRMEAWVARSRVGARTLARCSSRAASKCERAGQHGADGFSEF